MAKGDITHKHRRLDLDRALIQTEHLRKRTEFSARSALFLSEILDLETVLQRIGELSTPQIADWCAVDLTDGASSVLHRARVAYSNKNQLSHATALSAFDPGQDAESLSVVVLRSGVPMVLERTGKSSSSWRSRSGGTAEAVRLIPSERRLLDQLSAQSVAVFPLQTRSKKLGSLVLINSAGSPRAFDENSIHMARELALSASRSIDNAVHHREVMHSSVKEQEIFSIVAHELRTPLTGLRLGVDLINHLLRQNELKGIASSTLVRVLSRAETQITEMAELIDDLLDLSRIQSGRLKVEKAPTDLVELIKQALARFTETIESRSIKVVLKTPRSLVGDWDRLRIRQVLVNLISNAVKYGQDKPIEISVTRIDKKCVLSIRDQGIGIPEDRMPRLFERFERLHPTSGIPGLGLGLYIVKQIVVNHQGKIRVQSRPGKGTTFVVELPIQEKRGRQSRVSVK